MISHHISHSLHFLSFTDIFATSYMQFSHSNSKCECTLQDALYVQPIADSLGMGLPLIKVSNKYYDIADLMFLSLCLYVCTFLFLSISLSQSQSLLLRPNFNSMSHFSTAIQYTLSLFLAYPFAALLRALPNRHLKVRKEHSCFLLASLFYCLVSPCLALLAVGHHQ